MRASSGVLREVAAAVVLGPFAGPLLRLSLGRWPTAAEKPTVFATAFAAAASTLVPALLRALLAVPAAREQLLTAPRSLPPRQPSAGVRKVQPGRRGVAVVHIEKTAGTSLAHYLARALPGAPGADTILSMPAHLFTPIFGVDAPPVLRGHFDLPAVRRAGGDRFVLTLLRDPRRRVLSLYRYWRAIDPAMLPEWQDHAGVQAARKCLLLDFLRHPDPAVQDFISNVYVRRLTGLYHTGAARDPLEEDRPGAVAAAVAALIGLDFVGIAEDMPTSLNLLAAATGLPPPNKVPHLNVLARLQDDPASGFRRMPEEAMTLETHAALRKLTRLDEVRYRIARLRLEQQRAPAVRAAA